MATSTRKPSIPVLEEAGRFASEVIAPLNRVGDQFGTPFKDGAVTTPPGWKEAYTVLGRRRLERPRLARRLGRPGAAARRQRRLHRDVEFGLHGLRHRPGADHGGGRRALRLRLRRSQAALPREAHHRRMDGHHAAHRAAGRLRRRRAAQRRPNAPATAAIASPAARSSSPMASTTSPTTSSISCWRACPTRRPAPKASRSS